MAQPASSETDGLTGRWVFDLAPHPDPTQGLHLDSSRLFLHSFATGTPTARSISAAKVCSPDRYHLTALTLAKKEGSLSGLVKAADLQLAVLLARFVLEFWRCHERESNLRVQVGKLLSY
jgi:hypothetical protein